MEIISGWGEGMSTLSSKEDLPDDIQGCDPLPQDAVDGKRQKVGNQSGRGCAVSVCGRPRKDFALHKFYVWKEKNTAAHHHGHRLAKEILWPLRMTLVLGTRGVTINNTWK